MTVNHEVIGFAQNWRAEKALNTLGFQGFWLFLGSLPDTNSDVKFLKSSKNGGLRRWCFWMCFDPDSSFLCQFESKTGPF